MSALTLLTVSAPVLPGPPQGSSGEAASGFGALLALETDQSAAATEAAEGPAVGAGRDDALAEGSEGPGLLTAAVVIPPPPPSTPGPAGEGDAAVDIDGIEAGGLGGRAAGSAPAGDLDGPQGTTPLLGEKTPSAKTNDPQVQPPIAEVGMPGPSTGETALTVADAAAPEAVRPDARTLAVAAPPLMPMPAPLRPLAERTSRPLDAPVAGIGDTPRESTPATAAALAATPSVTPPAPPPGPAGPPASVVADVSSSDGGAAEFAPSGEGAAAPTDTPAVSREAALSQLSRVTIEATAQIAAQILRRLEGRSTRFEMALTPDELGRVDVKLDIDSEGRLNARLAFDNPAAATDLRGRADELRRQLEEAGFQLAQDAFEFAERDSGSSAFDRGQDARNGQSRAFTAAARLNAETDVAQPPRWMALSLSPSGVDMKV